MQVKPGDEIRNQGTRGLSPGDPARRICPLRAGAAVILDPSRGIRMRALLAPVLAALLLSSSPPPPPRFTDVSAASGAGGFWDVAGVGAADIDNDGYIDLATS